MLTAAIAIRATSVLRNMTILLCYSLWTNNAFARPALQLHKKMYDAFQTPARFCATGSPRDATSSRGKCF
jgi:hypothetical protein